MSYYVDIIDTLSPDTKLVIEYASASGIVLSWNGSDTKDDLSIVSSDLKFDMLTRTAEDGAFIKLFTGDEKRFKVLIKSYESDAIIWQGHILPDLYSEPYKGVSFFVSFGATDGLGRLKGRYLPDDYYSKEKSLIEILCKILSLTGLDLDLYFSPAIVNFVNKDWNTIYLDTIHFLDKKKKDAYSILDMLLKDTMCVCFQADNRWYIEGLNVRQLRKVKYEVYSVTNAVYKGVYELNRLLKKITPLAEPFITMIPPYNEIAVTHKKVVPNFPKTIAADENAGWAIVSGVVGEIYSTDWIGHGGMLEKCVAPSYAPRIYHRGTEEGGAYRHTDFPQDNTRFLSLRKKIYYKKGQRININIEFGLKRYYEVIPPPENIETWKNAFKYEILFNGDVIYGNADYNIIYFEDLNFDTGGKATLSIDHIFPSEGLFDVKIYGLTGVLQETNLECIIINKAEIKVFGFIEDQREVDLISGEFSIDKEVELTFADDSSGMSAGFRLSKLNGETDFFVIIDVPVLHSFELNNKKYLQLQLAGVNLVDENRYNVYSVLDNSLVEVIDVFYNFKDGEQMVIETNKFYNEGLYVKKYASDDIEESRLNWEQWTDVVYKIEKSNYAKIIANINRRIFNTAVEKIDLDVKNSVKFNDIILFNYVFEKDFFVLNCSWNLDDNRTTLVLGRSFYKDVGTTIPEDKNIPPIVLAGNDIYMSEDQNSIVLNATAYDPDGDIVNVVWTKEVGGFGDIIVSPNNLSTVIKNLIEDYYRFKIEVTDNDGDKASDFIDVYRVKTSNVALDLISETTTSPLQSYYLYRIYKLNIDPNLPVNAIVSFSGLLKTEAIYRNEADSIIAECGVIKNGVVLTQSYIKHGNNPKKVELSFSFNCISTDEITFYTRNSIKNHGNNYSYSEINIGTFVIVSGDLVITGLPIQKISNIGTA
ncbi:hypothetical protein CFS9_02960 [Flavobacterium sp. CFS9]|uniref:Uncharacterized protein n=1 Tax=Flavobacterium sp. CFS9 TaxID=3143118 RepID=A0AAT9GWP5_9FLAO